MADIGLHFLRSGTLAHKKEMLDHRTSSKEKTKLDRSLSEPFGLRHTHISEKKKKLDEQVQKHKETMTSNPFSGHYKTSTATKLSRDDPNYGRPVAGSKTERRGKNAAAHINAEVAFLCDMIYQEGEQYEDGTAWISFGDLFQIYTRISNKVVGTLLRARKHGLVYFEGETLFQRRDDDVPIYLVKPIHEIKEELLQDVDFEVGVCHKAPTK